MTRNWNNKLEEEFRYDRYFKQDNEQKKKQRCVFCSKVATTREHVPPTYIYQSPKPKDLITVPACKPCNSESSLDDEYFRWMVSLPGVSKEAIKLRDESILPRFTKKPKLLNKIMENSGMVDILSPSGLFLGTQPAFKFDRERIQTVIEKNS